MIARSSVRVPLIPFKQTKSLSCVRDAGVSFWFFKKFLFEIWTGEADVEVRDEDPRALGVLAQGLGQSLCQFSLCVTDVGIPFFFLKKSKDASTSLLDQHGLGTYNAHSVWIYISGVCFETFPRSVFCQSTSKKQLSRSSPDHVGNVLTPLLGVPKDVVRFGNLALLHSFKKNAVLFGVAEALRHALLLLYHHDFANLCVFVFERKSPRARARSVHSLFFITAKWPFFRIIPKVHAFEVFRRNNFRNAVLVRASRRAQRRGGVPVPE